MRATLRKCYYFPGDRHSQKRREYICFSEIWNPVFKHKYLKYWNQRKIHLHKHSKNSHSFEFWRFSRKRTKRQLFRMFWRLERGWGQFAEGGFYKKKLKFYFPRAMTPLNYIIILKERIFYQSWKLQDLLKLSFNEIC